MGDDPPVAGVWTSLQLLPRVGRGWAGAFAGMILWQGVSGVLYAVTTGALISSVPEAVGRGFDSPPGRRLLLALAVLAFLFLGSRVLVPVAGLVNATVARRFHRLVLRMLIDAGNGPKTIAHLEDPAVADRMSLAKGEQSRISSSLVVSGLSEVAVTYIGCIASAAVLARFAWWAPLVVVAGVLVERAWVRREIDAVIKGAAWSAPELRRAGYFRDLSLTAAPAKEMRVFGLGPWSAERFRATWWTAMGPVWRRRRQIGPLAVAAVAALVVTQGFVAFSIVTAGVDGRITLGDVTVYLQMAVAMAAIVWIPETEWQLRTSSSSVAYASSLHDQFAAVAKTDSCRPADGLPRTGIRFEGVYFRYPGGQLDVLAGLDLDVPAGCSLALVGLNGAGKTTLTKLLAGLYSPTGGTITVDGIDLSELDVASWRRRLAVIFQDFARYELSVSDNIGFGAPRLLGDGPALRRAAERAGAADLVEGLPDGWDSVLSRRFTGGAEPSGGQWQRIALARCFVAVEAGASVLVLDEPTAALDVRGEAELYERFLELTADLTTIVISHRFSTVRRADSIAVIEDGRVVEQGSHAELVAARGRYATMFALQAARLGLGQTSVPSDG